MRDLVLICFIVGFVVASFRRPYFMALGYIWVDFLQPQKLTYWFLNSAPLALIMALGAVAFYVFLDEKQRIRLSIVQVLVILLVLLATINTFGWALVPEHAVVKWDWVWKGLLFSVFLPWVLTTRRRVEAAAFVMVLSTAAITISGGIKTLLGGGGYGNVSFLVQSNTGLYEGSTLATVALCFIPLTLWLYRRNTILKRNLLTLLATAGIIFSMTLVTVGAEARTGLVAGAALVVLLWLGSKRKLVLAACFTAAAVITIPLLPESFTDRMSTIKNYDEDMSASTRIGVWKWTIDFVKTHPMGGGFGVYRINQFDVDMQRREGSADNMASRDVTIKKEARAFHNSFFEVLGELGYLGAMIYVAIVVLALHATWKLRNISTGDPESDIWFRDLGTMMAISMIVYTVGSMFVSIAFQPPYYDLLAITIAATHIARRERLANKVEDKFGPRVRAGGIGAPASAKA
ncbi:putative O-glycosylation ligase, exosortase A system-associated [Sphingosinicella soli]|uniref:Putative O-glycosylation ligase (Exosortase A-associated) n=1 Tax=Sphingosinicella soli TaxID=333708 RepID=A0A7W7B444_9SPHN|nr:putative O-glycosylation ligase, exosortase A system-associated [Sphingosinicella soli]MBB4633584.1 putative O-glycosylation ligase (exosortase A-associated) [Sphingosinicella soli]